LMQAFFSENQTPYSDARVVVLPVPFERTVTYEGGTQRGPQAILEASSHLELYDEELDRIISDIGIHTAPALDFPEPDIEQCLGTMEKAAFRHFKHGKFLVSLGGEHSITQPLVKAACHHFPGLGILHIDAHADLRDSYRGSPYNHGCVMARCRTLAPIVQVGIRSLSAGERAWTNQGPVRTFFAHAMAANPGWIEEAVSLLPPLVYVSLDVDGLDPSLVPATGTPEPGGLNWEQITALFRAVGKQKKAVGLDCVELAPQPGQHASDFICARLVYKSLGYFIKP
jgi:agmatinase